MKIYCYLENLPQMDCEHELRLILLWQESWKRQGFEPRVLNEYIARQHPYFKEYEARISALPSINPTGYDRACFLRWLAMAEVGGGLMSDYDVINYSQPLPVVTKPPTFLTCYQGSVPALVNGDAIAFLTQCERFAAYQVKPEDQFNGVPHVSDMYCLEKDMLGDPKSYHIHHLVKHYTEAGWETAKIVHYNNGTMAPAGKTPRHQHIPELRALLPSSV